MWSPDRPTDGRITPVLPPPFRESVRSPVEAGDLAQPTIGSGITVARQRRTFTGFAIVPRHPGLRAPLRQAYEVREILAGVCVGGKGI